MTIGIGDKLGVHEILSLLGRGGLGEVYRARDGRLKRDVAIKILPTEFARDGADYPAEAGLHEPRTEHLNTN
jgi:serine/threonine protein kinase